MNCDRFIAIRRSIWVMPLLFLWLWPPTQIMAQPSVLDCSLTRVPMVNGGGTFTTTFSQTNSGQFNLFNGWENAGNIIDNNLGNIAKGHIVVGPTEWIQVSDNNTGNVYPSGTFAGFLLKPGILMLNLLSNLTIETFLDGAIAETVTGTSLISLTSSLVSGAYDVGFYTSKDFNSVKLSFNGVLANHDVYYAFMRGTGSCSNTPLVANTPTSLTLKNHSVIVNPNNTGVSGVLGITAFANLDNIIDDDLNTPAVISNTASVLSSVRIAVANLKRNYRQGTFVGFDFAIDNLLTTNVLSGFEIHTYLNKKAQDTLSGPQLLVQPKLLANTKRQVLGAVAPKPFDEASLVVDKGLLNINLNALEVYSMVATDFVDGPNDCGQFYKLNTPTFPVSINSMRTGFSGLACANCGIDDVGNVIDANVDNFALVKTVAGAVETGSISVKLGGAALASGAEAGFIIESKNQTPLIIADLLKTISISVYEKNSHVETKQGATNLLYLQVLGIPGSGKRYYVGFKPTGSFDEIQISISHFVGAQAINNDVAVYGAYMSPPPGNCFLPNVFGAVNAAFKAGVLSIDWQALTEVNCVRYQIEGSMDGEKWTTLRKVASKATNGTSNATIDYHDSVNLSQLALGGLALAGLLFLPLFKNRYVRWALMMAMLGMVIVACKKTGAELQATENQPKFIRIAQENDQGQLKYSKIVSVVKK